MRKAGNILQSAWNRYQTDGHFQDIVETLAMAGISAGGQVMLTDMSPEEIAFSTLLGAGAGLAARPVLARGGYALGRQIDKRIPDAQDYGGMLSISSPRGREIYGKILEEVGGKDAASKDIILKLLKAKGNQNYVRPDGTPRGYVEGFLGSMGRNRGDNIAQTAVALTTPFIFGGEEDA